MRDGELVGGGQAMGEGGSRGKKTLKKNKSRGSFCTCLKGSS